MIFVYCSSGNFRRQNVRTRSCVRKLNVRNFSSQYIKYVCYYGKGSPVQKLNGRKIFDTKISQESVTNVPYVDCNYLYVRFCHGCFVFYNDDRSNREDVYHQNYYNSKASRDLQSMM